MTFNNAGFYLGPDCPLWGSIQAVIAESGVDEPNIVFVIGGFILVPMMALYGIAMTCCSVASKTASHSFLMYFTTEPSRYNQKLF